MLRAQLECLLRSRGVPPELPHAGIPTSTRFLAVLKLTPGRMLIGCKGRHMGILNRQS